MATVNLTIPDPVLARVTNAFLAQYPPPADEDVTTAAKKAAYVKGLILDYIKQVVAAHEASAAADTARDNAATKADTEINLT